MNEQKRTPSQSSLLKAHTPGPSEGGGGTKPAKCQEKWLDVTWEEGIDESSVCKTHVQNNIPAGFQTSPRKLCLVSPNVILGMRELELEVMGRSNDVWICPKIFRQEMKIEKR